jgi:hypothetical protein
MYQMAAAPKRATDPVARIHQRRRDRSSPGPEESCRLNRLAMNGRLSGFLKFCGGPVWFTPEDKNAQLVSGHDFHGAIFYSGRQSAVSNLRPKRCRSASLEKPDRLALSRSAR